MVMCVGKGTARRHPGHSRTVLVEVCAADGTGSKTWFYARSTVLARRCLSIGPVPPFRFTIAKRGRPKPASLFVAVLGASSYAFARATLTHDRSHWIESHVLAFEFFHATS